jgi:hypothetical protein
VACHHHRHVRAVDRAELMQDGIVGLLRALDRYAPDLGTPFWAYASWWVRLADLVDDHREERWRRRQMEDAVQRPARLLVEGPQHAGTPVVEVGAVERACHVSGVREQCHEHRVVGRAPRVSADRGGRHRSELLVGHLAARDADEVEALGQRALVGEVVERGEERAVGEVARRADYREVRRGDGNGAAAGCAPLVVPHVGTCVVRWSLAPPG